MKRLLYITLLVLGLTVPLLAAPPASAIDIFSPSGTTSACDNTNAASKPAICKDDAANSKTNPIIGPDGIITTITRLLALLVGIISVIIIIVSGLRLVLSGSDTNKATTARRGIVYSAVGLAIAAMAQALVTLVLTKL